MGTGSIWHWLILGLIIVLLFGRGRISELMGDVAGGIKAFKKGMAEDDEDKRVTPSPGRTIEGTATKDKTTTS